jgi:hypothetical protein
MTDPKNFVVTESTVFHDEEADLEAHDYRGPGRERLTEDATERYTAQRRGAGRPSLGDSGGSSPSVAFRLTAELRAEAEEVARREGRRVSAIARQALEEYIANHRAS